MLFYSCEFIINNAIMTGEKDLIICKIPCKKFKAYIDRFFDSNKYHGVVNIPELFSINSLGKNLSISKNGYGTVTIEIEPEEDDPVDSLPEFVTQKIKEEDVKELYQYIVDKIQVPYFRKAFTGADFNWDT